MVHGFVIFYGASGDFVPGSGPPTGTFPWTPLGTSVPQTLCLSAWLTFLDLFPPSTNPGYG